MDSPLCPQCRTPMQARGLCPACLLAEGAAESIVESASSFEPPPVAELAPLFPNLEIHELIGRGGMGAVYKARQTELDRTVALKILPPDIGGDPAFSERFGREAKALAKLNHPGIVTLYEFGRAGNLYYFLMEFVDGVNLRHLMAGERISTREALAIVPQICDALQYAHDDGIVHRDIKPENILIDRQGRVKVADFGLAKMTDAVPETAGKLMGTPAYMAPEQSDHPSAVDHRADIYALGVVFYQMLTGELPDKPLEAPSRKIALDVRLDEIVLRALEKNPELRFQQASVMKTSLEMWVSGETNCPSPRRKMPILAKIGILLLLTLPVCLMLPFLAFSETPREHLSQGSFTTPGWLTSDISEEAAKAALAPFSGVSLARRHADPHQWRLSAADPDQAEAQRKLRDAFSAFEAATVASSPQPLAEPMRMSGSTSISPALRKEPAQDFHALLQLCAGTGAALSGAGLLCLLLTPAGKQAHRFRRAAVGAGGAFLLGWMLIAYQWNPYHGLRLPLAWLMGAALWLPAMLLGIRSGSSRLGRLAAGTAWMSFLLSPVLGVPLPITGDEGWKIVVIPALPATEGNDEKLTYAAFSGEARTKAIEAWIQKVDRRDYVGAWNELSGFSRSLISRQQWTAMLEGSREPLGENISRKPTSRTTTRRLPGAPGSRYLVYTFESDFAAQAGVEEIVTLMLGSDDIWQIAGYSIK